MTLKVHRFTLYAIAGWLVLLAYFAMRDGEAALLSVLLTPAIGGLLLVAIAARHRVLSLFLGLALLSHAVAPPFFFLRRGFYTYGGGFGAVKNFGFGVGEFLTIYSHVLVFLLALVTFTIGLHRLWPDTTATNRRLNDLAPADPRVRLISTAALALFLLLVAMPMSVFMYANRIGITGLEPAVLPYRLTGILTYFRMLVVPVAIFIGLAFSSRGAALTLLIVAYTFVAGFASASRYVVLSSAAAVTLFALLDRRVLRLVSVLGATAAIFVLVTASRDYLYTEHMPLTQLVQTTLRNYDPAAFSPFELVGGIANRLWGPQDVVLAYQYEVPSRWTAIVNYFSLRPVVQDLTYEMYGMTFAGATAAFGVGLGYVPWMILLAGRSLPVLIALAFFTAVLLSLCERLVTRYDALPGAIGYLSSRVLAALFIYCIYPSNMNWFYQALLLAVLGLALERLRQQLPVRVRRARVGSVPASMGHARVLPDSK